MVLYINTGQFYWYQCGIVSCLLLENKSGTVYNIVNSGVSLFLDVLMSWGIPAGRVRVGSISALLRGEVF